MASDPDPVQVAVELLDSFSDEIEKLDVAMEKLDGKQMRAALDLDDGGDISEIEAQLQELRKQIETVLDIDVKGMKEALADKELLKKDTESTHHVNVDKDRLGGAGEGSGIFGGASPPDKERIKEIIDGDVIDTQYVDTQFVDTLIADNFTGGSSGGGDVPDSDSDEISVNKDGKVKDRDIVSSKKLFSRTRRNLASLFGTSSEASGSGDVSKGVKKADIGIFSRLKGLLSGEGGSGGGTPTPNVDQTRSPALRRSLRQARESIGQGTRAMIPDTQFRKLTGQLRETTDAIRELDAGDDGGDAGGREVIRESEFTGDYREAIDREVHRDISRTVEREDTEYGEPSSFDDGFETRNFVDVERDNKPRPRRPPTAIVQDVTRQLVGEDTGAKNLRSLASDIEYDYDSGSRVEEPFADPEGDMSHFRELRRHGGNWNPTELPANPDGSTQAELDAGSGAAQELGAELEKPVSEIDADRVENLGRRIDQASQDVHSGSGGFVGNYGEFAERHAGEIRSYQKRERSKMSTPESGLRREYGVSEEARRRANPELARSDYTENRDRFESIARYSRSAQRELEKPIGKMDVDQARSDARSAEIFEYTLGTRDEKPDQALNKRFERIRRYQDNENRLRRDGPASRTIPKARDAVEPIIEADTDGRWSDENKQAFERLQDTAGDFDELISGGFEEGDTNEIGNRGNELVRQYERFADMDSAPDLNREDFKTHTGRLINEGDEAGGGVEVEDSTTETLRRVEERAKNIRDETSYTERSSLAHDISEDAGRLRQNLERPDFDHEEADVIKTRLKGNIGDLRDTGEYNIRMPDLEIEDQIQQAMLAEGVEGGQNIYRPPSPFENDKEIGADLIRGPETDFLQSIRRGTRDIEAPTSSPFSEQFFGDTVSQAKQPLEDWDFFKRNDRQDELSYRTLISQQMRRSKRVISTNGGRLRKKVMGSVRGPISKGRSFAGDFASDISDIGGSERDIGKSRKAFNKLDNPMDKLGIKLKKLLPSYRTWINLISAVIPLVATLAGGLLGLAAALGGVAVAGIAIGGLGLMGLDDRKQEIQELKEGVKGALEPAANTMAPIMDGLMDQIPSEVSRLTEPLKGLSSFEGFFQDAISGGVGFIKQIIEAVNDLSGRIQQVTARFSQAFGETLIGLLRWAVEEVYENQDAFIKLGSAMASIIGAVYAVLKVFSFLIANFSTLFNALDLVTSLLNNKFIAGLLASVTVGLILATVLSKVSQSIALLAAESSGGVFTGLISSAFKAIGALYAYIAAAWEAVLVSETLAAIMAGLTLGVIGGGALLAGASVASSMGKPDTQGMTGSKYLGSQGGFGGNSHTVNNFKIEGNVDDGVYAEMQNDFGEKYDRESKIEKNTKMPSSNNDNTNG